MPPTAGLPPRWADLLGRRADTLEQALCSRLGLEDIEIVSTGTAALRIAFEHLRGPRSDGVVVVPAYTCPLVVLAAAAAGLRCVACDTVAGGFDLDLAHLRALIGPGAETAHGPPIEGAIVAIVPTHYGGVLTDVAAVRAVAPGIAIVEDAAQALGASWAGRSAGLAGDIGVLSLGAGKGLTIFEGGALVARDAQTMAALRRVAARLARPDPLGELGRAAMLAGYHFVYNPDGLRIVYGRPRRRALARGDEIEAAGDRFPAEVEIGGVGRWRKRVGRAALDRLEAHLEGSRARFTRLADRLEAVPGLIVHRPPEHANPSATVLFVTLPDHPDRHRLITALWRSRLGVTRMFARAIGDYPDLAAHMLPADTPNARELAAGTIAISTSSLMSPAAERTIVEMLREHAGAA